MIHKKSQADMEMAKVLEHYESHLAEHYSWLFGGMDKKCKENKEFFINNGVKSQGNKKAVDLGCGSGFQSIPLAELGFNVTAIDLSAKLLLELNENKNDLPIETVNADLLSFDDLVNVQPSLVICMGDTLTHLETFEDVENLFNNVYEKLDHNGKFIITFRDLTFELKDLDRFIPVNSDANTIFTCFLEYEEAKVNVHDLIYKKLDEKWELNKSFYKKLRISPDLAKENLEKSGFRIQCSDIDKGFVTIIAEK